MAFDIIQFFWEYFPYSLIPFTIFIPIIYFLTRKKVKVIPNIVEVFFKGGTRKKYKCIVDKSSLKFKIGEIEYSEPILYNPRIEETEEGRLRRVFMFAEGVGNVDTPELTQNELKSIWDFYIKNNVIDKDSESDYKDSEGKWINEKILEKVRFYNFEIEQILDKPTPKAFNVAMSAFENTVRNLIKEIERLESGVSARYTVGLFFISFMVGFGIAWALTLKGLI